jgi:cell division transport system permease protein
MLKGIKEMGTNKWEQLLTLMAVTLVTFLGALFVLIMLNLRHQVLENQSQIKFEVYWQANAPMQEVREQWEDLRGHGLVTSLKTFTPSQALEVLSNTMDDSVDLQWLEKDNPLPATAVIRLDVSGSPSQSGVKAFYTNLEGLQHVEKVHYNPLQVDQASSWTEMSQTIFWPFILFLTLLVGLIVGNTFKLRQLNKSEEIEVLWLVGAARWYIQLPLLTGAVLQAVLGGALALGFLKLAQHSLNSLLNVPPLWIEIRFLNVQEILAVLGTLALVALISSWVAIRR